jgi:hypothetical protein
MTGSDPNCNPFATYAVQVDWNNDGDYVDIADDVTEDLLRRAPIVFHYGRDQGKALSPTAPGVLTFTVCNADLTYSPSATGSPIGADVLPGRPARLLITPTGGPAVTGLLGRIDDLDIKTARGDLSVDITVADALQAFSTVKISTELNRGLRTGDALHLVLDAVGWPAAQRDIDPGATYIPWWWEDQVTASEAIEKLVLSEGPPAICYVNRGIVTFKDRHHRIIDANTLISQGTYCVAQATVTCTTPSPCVTGAFPYTDPVTYDHGLKNVVNTVSFSVEQRMPAVDIAQVFSTDATFAIDGGDVLSLVAQSSDPFFNAITPVEDTDYTVITGSVAVNLTRDNGGSTIIQIGALGAPAVVHGMALRAKPVSVVNTVQINVNDSVSIAKYGEQTYPNGAPWANVYDARAIADVLLGQRANRVPIVSVRTVNGTQALQNQMLARGISDRVTIRNDPLGLNTDFYVERIEQSVRALGRVHASVLGCEQVITQPGNAFQFDVAGHGFDDGAFGLTGFNDAATVFQFDNNTSGHRFNEGLFAY